MRESSGVSIYRGLPEKEAFDIEYWLLEEAKLQRMPKPKRLPSKSRSLPVALAALDSRPPDDCSTMVHALFYAISIVTHLRMLNGNCPPNTAPT